VILNECKRRGMSVSVACSSFLNHNWEAADVCLFDTTSWIAHLDEGLLLLKFEVVAQAMQAGSIILLVTHWNRQFLGSDFALVYEDLHRRIDASETVHIRAFRKKSASKSKEERVDLEKGIEAAKKL